MVPLKVLLLLVSPLPALESDEFTLTPVSRLMNFSSAIGKKGILPEVLNSMPPVRLLLLLALFTADRLSSITMTTTSPTRRATGSSNSGRAEAGW